MYVDVRGGDVDVLVGGVLCSLPPPSLPLGRIKSVQRGKVYPEVRFHLRCSFSFFYREGDAVEISDTRGNNE